MDVHTNVSLSGHYEGGEIQFPVFSIASGEFGFFPYRMSLGNAVLKCALATPLCQLRTAQGEDVFVFYAIRPPVYNWETAEKAHILHLSRTQALKAVKVHLDQDYLVLADNFVWVEDGTLVVVGEEETEILTYPQLSQIPKGFTAKGTNGEFSKYVRRTKERELHIYLSLTSRDSRSAKYTIQVEYPAGGMGEFTEDFLLAIQFLGNRMDLFCSGQKVNDYFYTGQDALVSLRYLSYPSNLEAEVFPLLEEDKTSLFLEAWPDLSEGPHAEIADVSYKRLVQ